MAGRAGSGRAGSRPLSSYPAAARSSSSARSRGGREGHARAARPGLGCRLAPPPAFLPGLPSRIRVSARGRASCLCLPCAPETRRPRPPLPDGVSLRCTWVDGGRAEGSCSLRLWGTELTAARGSCLHCAFVHTRGVGSQDPGETGLGGAQVAQVCSLPLRLLSHFGPYRRLASLGIC